MPAFDLDIYGGLTALPSPNSSLNGYFRIEKNNGRWTFITPLGNAFYMLASYGVSYVLLRSGPAGDIIVIKYASNSNAWSDHNNRRLLEWGFNTVGDYAAASSWPIRSTVKLPFILIVNGIADMVVHPTLNGLTAPPKNIITGIPTNIGGVFRGGRMIDMFDTGNTPGVSVTSVVIGYQTAMSHFSSSFTGGWPATNPYLLGITPDDPDYLYGLKNRGDAPYSPHANIGFCTAVTAFDYTPFLVAPQTDPVLYSKYEWINFMKARYNNDINALNTAWSTGGFYTSFDDAGGYGVGTGLIDEDGRHTTWMGSGPNVARLLTGTNPNAVIDFTAFVYHYTYYYSSLAITTIRSYDTNHLIFGPPSLGAGGYASRHEVLQALKDAGVQVFVHSSMSLTPGVNLVGAVDSYDFTGIPCFLWYSLLSQEDSRFSAFPGEQQGVPDLLTQELRGQQYASDNLAFFNSRATNGDYHIIGINWWSYVDSDVNQHTNWGLISLNDNAYNRVESSTLIVRDDGGYTTIPEPGNYGDFINPIIQSNNNLKLMLVTGLPPANVDITTIGPG